MSYNGKMAETWLRKVSPSMAGGRVETELYSPGWQVLMLGSIFAMFGITDKEETKFKSLRCHLWRISKLKLF